MNKYLKRKLGITYQNVIPSLPRNLACNANPIIRNYREHARFLGKLGMTCYRFRHNSGATCWQNR